MYLEEPRQQHYYFVHRFLRDRALNEGAYLMERLEGDGAVRYLQLHWIRVGYAAKSERDEFIPGDGLEVHPFRIGTVYRAAIIKFPEPRGPAEAFMAAVVVSADAKPKKAGGVRYFTLELAPSRSNKMAFCEWTGDSHRSLVNTPQSASSEDFKSQIVAIFEPSRDRTK